MSTAPVTPWNRLNLARFIDPSVQYNPSTEPIKIEPTTLEGFKKAFAVAAASNGPVFLTDSTWGLKEKEDFAAIFEAAKTNYTPREKGWLMIPSGGTTGKLKFARHDEQNLLIGATGFAEFFNINKINAVIVLPPNRVSGLMHWFRATLTGGQTIYKDWKRIENGEFPAEVKKGDGWVLGTVPTQLQALLLIPNAIEWLREFDVITVGGGAVWPQLADDAAKLGLRISTLYGSTETGTNITSLRPEEFLNGNRSLGKPLPFCSLSIAEDGTLAIKTETAYHGYYPEYTDSKVITTQDLAELDKDNYLTMLGRKDHVIITGGKKADPVEIEAVLRASKQFKDVSVIGIPNEYWGSIVIALYPDSQTPDLEIVKEYVFPLAKFKRPKLYIHIPANEWPRTIAGKVNKQEMLRLAQVYKNNI